MNDGKHDVTCEKKLVDAGEKPAASYLGCTPRLRYVKFVLTTHPYPYVQPLPLT